MKGGQVTRVRGKSKKNYNRNYKKDLEIDGLDRNMVFDRTL